MNESRFQSVVILHDRDNLTRAQTDDNRLSELMRVLSESHPAVKFLCPELSLGFGTVESDFNIMAVRLLPMFRPNSLVVGEGLGGLLALMLQQRFVVLNLSVFAINPLPPTDTTYTESLERVIIYSHGPSQWTKQCSQSFEIPWIANGVNKALYATSYLISTFMRGLDVAKELASMPQSQSQSAGL